MKFSKSLVLSVACLWCYAPLVQLKAIPLWVHIAGSTGAATSNPPAGVTFRAVSGGNITGTPTVTANYPDATEVNDIMILAIATDLVSVASGTPPAGWTLLNSVDAGADSTLHVFWKRSTTSNPATETWADIFPVNNSGAYRVVSYSGAVTTGSPFNASGTNSSGFTSAWTVSLTTTAANSLVVAVFGADTVSTEFSVTYPVDATERADFNNAGSGFVAIGDVPVASPGVKTVAVTPFSADSYAAAAYALTPAP